MFEQPDPEVVETIRAHIARLRDQEAQRFRRQCEECKRLALDATPMTAGERAQLERRLERGTK